jgi:hypothetical protein
VVAVGAIWAFAFRVPFLNLLAGPMNGALLAIAVLAGVPARRGRLAQVLAFSLYLTSLIGVAGATASRIIPWPYENLPVLRTLFLGAHGGNLVGVAGIAIGAAIAGIAPRAIETAQPADEPDGPAAGTS